MLEKLSSACEFSPCSWRGESKSQQADFSPRSPHPHSRHPLEENIPTEQMNEVA